ncbi:MAG: hypothetical protein Q4D04_15025, partial [Clostridia bacterium]|nr:hypothetical protein [Clostridia bacterium]
MKKTWTIITILALCLTLVCIGAVAADRAERAVEKALGVKINVINNSASMQIGEEREIEIATIPNYDDLTGIPGPSGGDVED